VTLPRFDSVPKPRYALLKKTMWAESIEASLWGIKIGSVDSCHYLCGPAHMAPGTRSSYCRNDSGCQCIKGLQISDIGHREDDMIETFLGKSG
jgi:hypothetical protein